MQNVITDKAGHVVRRTITFEGWRTVQVRQSDGSWWNIRTERVR